MQSVNCATLPPVDFSTIVGLHRFRLSKALASQRIYTIYSRIITFDYLDEIRASLGSIVCTSGGFDPVHSGHISCIRESKEYGDSLIVIINGDNFLTQKKGVPFMNLEERCRIVSSIKDVDYVVPFEVKNDLTVIEALKRISPNTFTKGGDRNSIKNIPEWDICQKIGCQIILGVGNKKKVSSSLFLEKWKKNAR